MKLRVSWLEWGVVVLLLGVLAAILLPALGRARESARRSSCANNLKQAGLLCKMFASESKNGLYPPLSPIPGNWIMDVNRLYPEYVTDLNIFICPTSPFATRDTFRLHGTLQHPASEAGELHPDCVSCLFYTYTGYSLMSDEQALGLFEAYQQGNPEFYQLADVRAQVPVWPDSARPTLGSEGIPIMWDRIPPIESDLAHVPPGANVLHHDGHVEFVRYSPYNASNNFPLTRITALTLGSTLPRLSPDCY